MSGLFIEILNMSISGGCVALIVMLVRLALKKVPKIYSYVLWAVVFVRLICPFTVQLPVSAVPVQPKAIPQDIIYSESPSIQSGVPMVDDAANNAIESALPPVGPVNSVNPVHVLLEVGAYIWLAGVFALLLYGVISYLRLKKRVATAIRVQDNIFETDLIKTPFVLGFTHPKIYIPTGLSVKEMEYIAEHERTHISRLDYLIKPLTFSAACVHWFNPVVWASLTLMARDMEMSADERVMKQYDSDIRGSYSNSLLALSAKRSGLLSPLAFGETGVKERVKNVLNYKKPAFWVSAAAVAVVAVVSISFMVSGQTEVLNIDSVAAEIDSVAAENDSIPAEYDSVAAENDSVPAEHAIADEDYDLSDTQYYRVEIEFLSEIMGFKSASRFDTAVPEIVAYIDSTIRTAPAHPEKEDLDNNHTNRYAIKLSNSISGYGCNLYYDTLYNKAFIVKDGGLSETSTDFARYIDSLLENKNIDADIGKSDAAGLFKLYGWTLDYRISTIENKLNDINSLLAFNPNAYYFAYNNELSKDIGLDMSGYSNTADIDVEIYRIRESLPQEFYPIQNCRGIVVKKGGKIIGAFISAGRHSTFNACSLKGNSFENAAGKTLGQWLADRVEADSAEERLSKLKPEEVIGEYFTALGSKDAKAAGYCISKKALLGNLSSNLPHDELFNERIGLPLTDTGFGAKSNFDNLKSAKLIKIEPVDDTESNVKIFRVTVNLQYNKEQTISSGEQFWDCRMVYESPQTGWKIEGFGH